MFSIDQNCHSLWDVLPKLYALCRRGHNVRHFIEDIDAAFTSLGSGLEGGELRLVRERFHRSGGQDWGAALFYSQFLGRLPVEIREWEPLTGLKTKVLAGQLGRSVDDLYDEFSPGETWQLIGASYVGDREHHRVIGDLSVAETAEFLRRVMEKARQDTLGAFPEEACRKRTREWFDQEQQRLDRLIEQCKGGRLVDLYRHWLREYLPKSVRLETTSSLLALRAGADRFRLLDVFVSSYELAANLYNEAVEETSTGLRPLKLSAGELPFFAVMTHEGHTVRAPVWLRGDAIRTGRHVFPLANGRRLPLEAMAEAGIECLAGKAILLTMQARLGPIGEPLALPFRGSLYMPTGHRLAEKLAAHGLLGAKLHPLVRVRFHLLDRLGSLKTTIRLPEHLSPCFGREEIPAGRLGQDWPALAEEAAQRLEAFKDPARRERWQKENFPAAFRDMVELDLRRRQLAESDPKGPEIRAVWKQIKALRIDVLDRTVRQIARDWQMSRIDYWDSRGALLPWCVAAGGEAFYDELVAKAEIYEEPGVQVGRP